MKYGGIKDLISRSQALLLSVDAMTDTNAVREAQTLGVPVFYVLTPINLTGIDYVIQVMTTVKGIQLLLDYFTLRLRSAGIKAEKKRKPAEEK